MSAEMPSGGLGNSGKKRFREKPIKIYERIKRDRDEYLKAPRELYTYLFSEKPNIAKFGDCIHEIKEKEIDNLTATINNPANQLVDIEKCTKELDDIITMYPKLSGYLKKDLLENLVELLKNKQNPKLQSLAASILQYVFAHSSNGKMVIKNITSEIVVNLISSNHSDVHVQALELLHSIALTNPGPKFNAIFEEALEPLSLLLSNEFTKKEALYSGSKALAAVCQVYPELPPDKLQTVLHGLTKLLEHDSLEILSHACSGFGYLCDGRHEMVVENESFKSVVDLLVQLIMLWYDLDSPEIPLAALAALGSIVRWCTDEFIEFMIHEDEVWIIEQALTHEELYYVKNACWIYSNITAGLKHHLKDAIDTRVIDLLVRVVESYQYIEAKEEAMWALLNVIYGVCSDNEGLKNKCVKPLWRTLKACRHHEQMVYLCLEGLVKLEGIEITCNDEPVVGAAFKEFLVDLFGGVQVEGIEWLVNVKKLCRSDSDSNEKGCDNLVFHLTCTFEEEDAQRQQPLFLSYNSSYEDLPYVWSDSCEMADMMQ